MPRTPYQPGISTPYDQLAHMEYLIDQYSRATVSLPISAQNHQQPRPTSILLTGSTGNLGSDILALLIADPKVTRIYALNRHSHRGPALARVTEQFQKKGLELTALQSNKLTFIEADTTKDYLGIETGLYNEIRDSITVILHNAWPINLDKSLAYFEPQLLGLRHLIDLGHRSSHSSALRLIFISSFQAFQSWHMHYNTLLPEQVIMDTAVGCGRGYGASKYVAERILSRSGLESTSIRLTQLCGRSCGDYWSPSEWVPIFMSAGVQEGVLPDIAGLMAFIPLNDAATCVHDIVSFERSLPAVLNISHPRPIRWNLIFDTINDLLQEHWNLDPLPSMQFSQWLLLIRNSERMAKIKHPALKLVASNIEGMSIANDTIVRQGRQDIDHFPKPELSIDAAQIYSASLRNLKQIMQEDVRRWVQYGFSTIYRSNRTVIHKL